MTSSFVSTLYLLLRSPVAHERSAILQAILTVSTAFHHALLFTGHMIDSPDRAAPRFPARAVPAARIAIRCALETILLPQPGGKLGLAGGASGGDILFHELCLELAVPTRLYLALPVDQFRVASVAPAGSDWVRRFDLLIARLDPSSIHVLGTTSDEHAAPSRPDLNIWARTNLWMLDEAITLAPRRTLLAFWDGLPGDAPGGTEHLVSTALSLGVDVLPPIQPSFV